MSRENLPRPIAALTAAMAKGSEDAWTEFHHAYFDRLHRYLIVLQRGDEDLAAELVQLTLLRAVRHIRPFGSEQVLWSWLTCLARCAAADEGRVRKRRVIFLEKLHHWQEMRRSGNNDAELLRCEQLTRCLANLPDDDRGLLEGKYFERQSYNELAKQFGLSEKAVESRLVRLRAKLRKSMETIRSGGDT